MPLLPQRVQTNATTVLMHHAQLLPRLDTPGTPALLCPLQNGQPGWGTWKGMSGKVVVLEKYLSTSQISFVDSKP